MLIRNARMSRAVPAGVSILLVLGCAQRDAAGEPPPATPSAAVADLLAADRAFAAAATGSDLITALTSMFADDVVMPAPGVLATGKGEVLDALRSNPANPGSRIEWTPIRGGISGDGQHGFTYGYTTATRADGSKVPGKYVAYWVRTPDGWRVSVYTRKPRAEGTVSLAERPPSLPPSLVAPGDASARARFADELAGTERAFSRDAQTMGLGPAFVRYSAPDAMNAGGPQDAEFLFGPEAIGRGVGSGMTAGTTITWGPDSVRVATSGDLGVTMGFIAITPTGGETRRVPFFTIWRRDEVRAPWKFVAE